MEYEILKTEGRAKRARVSTVHGEIQTPVFMNVGTVAAIKGAVSTTIERNPYSRQSCPIRIIFM